ncbi:MAG: DMT family transporter [Alphaproteobacteria bacterium]|nr:DMT family transporter [Alphaproteobacteria bacterium]
MTWAYVAAILAPLVYGFGNIVDEKISRSIARGSTITFYVTITNLVFTPVLFIFYPFQVPPMDILLLCAAAGISFTLMVFPYFLAFKYLDTSVIAALGSLSLIFAPILAFFVIGEVMAPTQYLGLAVILVATVLLNLKKGVNFGINAGLWLMALVHLLWTISEVGKKAALAEVNLASVYFFAMLASVIFISLILFSKRERVEIRAAWPTFYSKMSLFALGEVLQMVSMALGMFAMIYLQLSVVVGLHRLQPFFTLLIGAIVLWATGKTANEALDRNSVAKKLACFALMVLGAVMLT